MSELGKILVVEDEAVVAVDLEMQLESAGYDVVAAVATPEEACREARNRRPDLVLMDIRLGSQSQSDGIAAASEIRRTLDIPVVFLTAFSDRQTVQRASEVGAHGYLVKPIQLGELYSAIETALAKGKQDRAVRHERDELLAVLDTMRHGTLIIDTNGDVRLASRAAAVILEAGKEELLGRHWTELIDVAVPEMRVLQDMIASPPERRTPLTLHLKQKRRVVEAEVYPDPQDPQRRYLFLYDVSQVHQLRKMLDKDSCFEEMIGKSDAMQQVFRLIAEVAPTEASVLIDGPTGTGKELAARAIHRRSSRRDRPLVALNCGGLGEELASSQLFGHRRGAFTGASADQAGLFEAANGGTLFLDEIGELPPRVQTMLLRALEEKAVRRLGDAQLRPVDVRVIAATNRTLHEEVADGTFRADLLYRLRVCRITLPPLSQRREDVPLLVREFLVRQSACSGKSIDKLSDAALCILLAHDWPGGVRELKNAVEFALIRAKQASIEPADLPPEVLESAAAKGLLDDATGDERGRILAMIQQTGGNRREAAKRLGISRATLYRRMESLAISTDDLS